VFCTQNPLVYSWHSRTYSLESYRAISLFDLNAEDLSVGLRVKLLSSSGSGTTHWFYTSVNATTRRL